MAADTLLQQTHSLRSTFFEKEGDLLGRLAREGQRPPVMFVGCSDSRVIPEALTGSRPGDLFVLRNIANIIPPFGTAHESTGAALEYAANHLKVAHLVVCGHTDCGGIKALDDHLDSLSEPSLARWIKFAREAQTRVDQHRADPSKRHRAIVEQNVLLQLQHAGTYPSIHKAVKENRLVLHGWLFDLQALQVLSYNFQTKQFEAV